MDLKKAGNKKQGHSYSKREQAAWMNNNDPDFFTLLFSGPYFGPDFFQGHKLTLFRLYHHPHSTFLGSTILFAYINNYRSFCVTTICRCLNRPPTTFIFTTMALKLIFSRYLTRVTEHFSNMVGHESLCLTINSQSTS